jgi:hypothetical protein
MKEAKGGALPWIRAASRRLCWSFTKGAPDEGGQRGCHRPGSAPPPDGCAGASPKGASDEGGRRGRRLPTVVLELRQRWRRMKEAERGAVDQDPIRDSSADFTHRQGAEDGHSGIRHQLHPPSSRSSSRSHCRARFRKEPPKKPRSVEDQSSSPTPVPCSAPPPT